MKKLPRSLADAEVMVDVLEYLYTSSEEFYSLSNKYEERAKAEDEDMWLEQSHNFSVKAAAYKRLADKLAE